MKEEAVEAMPVPVVEVAEPAKVAAAEPEAKPVESPVEAVAAEKPEVAAPAAPEAPVKILSEKVEPAKV